MYSGLHRGDGVWGHMQTSMGGRYGDGRDGKGVGPGGEHYEKWRGVRVCLNTRVRMGVN